MSRLYIILLVCACAAAVVSGSRLESKGAVCSVTEANSDPQYGISFQYDTAGECSNSNCNIFKFMSSGLPKIVKGTPSGGDGEHCVCTGDDNEILQGKPGKNAKCGTTWCWDLYSFLLRKDYYAASTPGEWLTSPNHWKADCGDGSTSIPSYADFKAGRAGPGASDIVPDAKVDGSDMKDEEGKFDDDEVLDDLDLEDDEEGSLDDEEKECPELASVVSNTEARVEAETRTIENYRTLINALEIEVPELEATTKTQEEQKAKYETFFKRLTETEGGSRICSVTEKIDHMGFDVSFAYGMTRKCSTINCNQITFFNDQLKLIVKGSESETGKNCVCTMVKQKMFSYKYAENKPCSSDGCWQLYTSIRDIARKSETGKYPPASKSLFSISHFDANCDAGAVTKIPSPVDVAEKLIAEGKTDAAKKMLKLVQLVETDEQTLTEEMFQKEVVQDGLADGQKATCTQLAKKLAQLEEALHNQEGVSFDTQKRVKTLSGEKAELIAKMEDIKTQIQDVAKLMTKKEIDSI